MTLSPKAIEAGARAVKDTWLSLREFPISILDREAEAIAKACLAAALETDGMVLVPKEPTEAMIEAGIVADEWQSDADNIERIYRAMLAASPPAGQEG